MGIVTSKRARSTRRGLRRCEIPIEWFRCVVTADDVARFKPDPQPVLAALEAMGERDASRALLVGDSVHDMRAGRAAGTATAAAVWGPFTRGQLETARPDFWAARPESILRILGEGTASGALPKALSEMSGPFAGLFHPS
jgi:pyrophosphatase PpaX